MFTTVIIFILVLSVLVFAHELGHFWTARRFGIRVEEFGFGFPPRAVGWYKNRFGRRVKVVGSRTFESLSDSEVEKLQPAKDATIYSLNWLPVGGFVKIKGENGDGRNDEDSFASKAIWKRSVVLAAGVIMNVILAWGLFSVGYMIGLPQSTGELGKHAIVSEEAVLVAEVLPNTPAERAGLLVGDKIISVDGEKVRTEKDLQEKISLRGGREINLALERDGSDLEIKAEPQAAEGGKATVGIVIFSAGTVRYPFFPALLEGAKTVGWTLKEIVVAFVGLFGDIFSGVNVGDQFAGPIGIANITGQAARLGLVYLLQFTALLSLNLAIINILPFPALDGGRILFLLIEKLKGRPMRKEFENLANTIGFYLLMALIVFITYKDIAKLF